MDQELHRPVMNIHMSPIHVDSRGFGDSRSMVTTDVCFCRWIFNPSLNAFQLVCNDDDKRYVFREEYMKFKLENAAFHSISR
jgi:hypothetical protein